MNNCKNNDTPPYYRPLHPCGQRRAKWHDYYAPGIYMITVNRAPGIRPFSVLCGNPPQCILNETGTDISRNLLALTDEFPGVRILKYVVMPEHVHFVLYVTVHGLHPGKLVNRFKSLCTRHYNGYAEDHDASEARNIKLVSVFEPGYHDRILMDGGQLDRMIRYVADNPRRRLDRMAHPDCHRRTVLTDGEGKLYEAYGDPNILDAPEIQAVRVSRSYTAEQLRNYKLKWMRTVLNGGVLASPFISEAERRVRDWAVDNGGCLIVIEENGFGHNYAPKEPWHTLCTQGRLLIVAPARHSTSAVKLTRAICLDMNGLAAEIAAHGLRPVKR